MRHINKTPRGAGICPCRFSYMDCPHSTFIRLQGNGKHLHLYQPCVTQSPKGRDNQAIINSVCLHCSQWPITYQCLSCHTFPPVSCIYSMYPGTYSVSACVMVPACVCRMLPCPRIQGQWPYNAWCSAHHICFSLVTVWIVASLTNGVNRH